MAEKLNIPEGTRYGRWVIISEATPADDRGHVRRFLCQCDCGRLAVVRLTHMRRGVSNSCGCWRKENSTQQATKHGQAGGRIYMVWKDMMRRCYNEKYQRYPDWGGRGIKICPEWHDISTFAEWSKTNGYKHGLLIDRINNDEDYSPTNCKWSTMKEQGNNRRNSKLITFQDKTMTETQWANALGITQPALHERLSKGWPIDRALTTRSLQPDRVKHDSI